MLRRYRVADDTSLLIMPGTISRRGANDFKMPKTVSRPVNATTLFYRNGLFRKLSGRITLISYYLLKYSIINLTIRLKLNLSSHKSTNASTTGRGFARAALPKLDTSCCHSGCRNNFQLCSLSLISVRAPNLQTPFLLSLELLV